MNTRRTTDHDKTVEIEKMIAEETDPRVRVQLLMMHSLTSAVSNINATVNDLDKKFSEHSKNEERIVNQVQGAWRVAALWWKFVGGVVVAAIPMVAYFYIDLSDATKALAVVQHQDMLEHERIITRVTVLESKRK